jgi:hypothetical protein
MQHFLLTLECGHTYEESAVDEVQVMQKDGDGKSVVKTVPYQPDYVGRDIAHAARCGKQVGCDKPKIVTEQKKIPALTGRHF